MHKLGKFSSDPGRVNFKLLLHLLRFIRNNKTLGLKYYADINDAPVSDPLRQASIKTENQLIDLSGSGSQDFPGTDRSTVTYIILFQDGKIDYGTHIAGTVSQSGAEIEYNAACTAGMALEHFRILIN